MESLKIPSRPVLPKHNLFWLFSEAGEYLLISRGDTTTANNTPRTTITAEKLDTGQIFCAVVEGIATDDLNLLDPHQNNMQRMKFRIGEAGNLINLSANMNHTGR